MLLILYGNDVSSNRFLLHTCLLFVFTSNEIYVKKNTVDNTNLTVFLVLSSEVERKRC